MGAADERDLDRVARFLLAPAENDDGAAASSASGVAATTSSPPAPCVFVAGVRVWDRRARRCRGVASSTAAMEAGRGVGFVVVVVVVVVAWRSRGTATGAGVSAPSGGAVTRAMSASHSARSATSLAATPASSAFVSLAVRAARSAWSLVNVASMTRSSPRETSACVTPLAPPAAATTRAVSSSSDGRGQCAGHGGAAQTLLGMPRAGSVARLAHLEFKLG